MTSKLRPLLPGYVAEFDSVNEGTWCELLSQFNDASIYQTWTYDEVRCGAKNLSHMVLKKDGVVVALAQARLVRIPLVKAGIAYLRWAPIWRSRTRPADIEDFRQAVRALRNEYACKRGLVLRLYPNVCGELNSAAATALAEEGFGALNQKPDRTLLLDLSPSLEDIHAGFRKHWRKSLKSAEKFNLEIVEGTSDELFHEFVVIYREMVRRKKFVEPNDIEHFRVLQSRLPEDLKMRVMIAKQNGAVCAGVICSAIGESALYLFGATSDAGLKSFGSYALHWKMIEWLKGQKVDFYDLNGINPETNPGTYKFKADMCGETGRDVYFLGRFETCTSALSQAIVTFGDRARAALQNQKQKKNAPQDSAVPKAPLESAPQPEQAPVSQ